MDATFLNSNNYITMKALFDAERDFMVIGLCGQTGSGVSETAKLLQEDFDDLHLSAPSIGGDTEEQYCNHEYNILYTYAKQNWTRFYGIKVSALITARVLQNIPEDFASFLMSLGIPEDKEDDVKAACTAFFQREIAFDLDNWFDTSHSPTDNPCTTWLQSSYQVRYWDEEKKSGWLVKPQRSRAERVKYEEWMTQSPKTWAGDAREEKVNFPNKEICIRQHGSSVLIKNQDLYWLFGEYQKNRDNKKSFGNDIYYWILKDYIYTALPVIVSELWCQIGQFSQGLPNLAMQELGIDLRISRVPLWTDSQMPNYAENGYAVIAEDINLAIKLLRTSQDKWFSHITDQQKSEWGHTAHKHTLVIIDSIRNPFESMYLKQRYTNYYLMGVYTENVERETRLLKKRKFSQLDIQTIDQIERLSEFKKVLTVYDPENPDKSTASPVLKMLLKKVNDNGLRPVLPFILPNVEGCLESADIFINNQRDNSSRLKLKKTLLRYVSLIMYPGLVLPTHLERCMQTAYTAKANSGCISRQVGAVITDKDYHILSVGWNQQPDGQLPCSYRNLCELCSHFSPEAYSDYENDDDSFGVTNDRLIPKIKECVQENFNGPSSPLQVQGRLPLFCFKDLYNDIIKGYPNQVHPRSLHAEETAFLNLGPMVERARGGCLFTTASPCELCSKKVMYLGISRVYYVEPYAGISYTHVLSAGPKDQRPEFILLTGAVGRAYMQLYTPILPLKDENEMWVGKKMKDFLKDKQAEQTRQVPSGPTTEEGEAGSSESPLPIEKGDAEHHEAEQLWKP